MKYLYLFVSTLLILFLNITAKAENPAGNYKDLQTALIRANTQSEKAKALVDMGRYYVLKPGSEFRDMQIAKKYCEAAGKITKTLNSDVLEADRLFALSLVERESGNQVAGKERIIAAIDLYRKANARISEGLALMELRQYYGLENADLDKRIQIVTEALQIFKSEGDKMNQGHANLELGDLYEVKDEPDLAIPYLQKAADIYKILNYGKLQDVYNLLGTIYTDKADYSNGLKYGLSAVQIGEKIKDTTITLATTYNRVAVTYARLNQFDKALSFLEKALIISIRNKWDDGIFVIISNMIDMSMSNGTKMLFRISYLENIINRKSDKISIGTKQFIEARLAFLFLKSGNMPKAAIYVDKCLKYGQDHELALSDKRLIYSIAMITNAKIKRLDLAKHYKIELDKIKAPATDIKFNSMYYLAVYKLDSALGNYKDAFLDHQFFKTFEDSTKARRSRREVTMLAAKYDLQQKDVEIKFKTQNINLLTKDIKAQKELVKRSDTIRNVTIVAVIMLILLLAALYSRWSANKKYSRSIDKKNERLQQLVQEKEWLVREIHHRVKNNLQTIISLIDSQASYLSNDALTAVMDSQHRIQAMSLIHQKLYMVENTTTIDMRTYIGELVSYLKDSFGADGSIIFSIDVDEIDLDISSAIPVGLVLNEAITNAIKYAFPNGRCGEIAVSLKETTDSRLALTIKDNGVGLKPDFDFSKVQSLGMSLMYGLTSEVSGEIKIDGSNGTSVSLIFKAPEFAV